MVITLGQQYNVGEKPTVILYTYYREYPVAFGQKREIAGVGQSDTANNTLCRYCFQVHRFLAKKASSTPFPSGTYYFSICDHGPDSWHAVICDKLTFFPLTGGCSEGLGAFSFFFK